MITIEERKPILTGASNGLVSIVEGSRKNHADKAWYKSEKTEDFDLHVTIDATYTLQLPLSLSPQSSVKGVVE